MKVSGIGDGFGYTQSRKSNSMKDVVGDVHGISGEKKKPRRTFRSIPQWSNRHGKSSIFKFGIPEFGGGFPS